MTIVPTCRKHVPIVNEKIIFLGRSAVFKHSTVQVDADGKNVKTLTTVTEQPQTAGYH
jgi:hypothetical protein